MDKRQLNTLILEELQYFMNEVKERRLYKTENGQWFIDAEVGNFPISEYGYKSSGDTAIVFMLRNASNDETGQMVEDYGMYYPSEAAAWAKRAEFKNKSNVTVGVKKINLNSVKANNRGRKVSLVSIKKGIPAAGKLIKVLPLPKSLSEIAASEMDEISVKDFLKTMGPASIMAYALGAYSFIIKNGEELSFAEWSSKIKNTYDLSNNANLTVYNAVKSIGRNALIIKSENGELTLKGKRV